MIEKRTRASVWSTSHGLSKEQAKVEWTRNHSLQDPKAIEHWDEHRQQKRGIKKTDGAFLQISRLLYIIMWREEQPATSWIPDLTSMNSTGWSACCCSQCRFSGLNLWFPQWSSITCPHRSNLRSIRENPLLLLVDGWIYSRKSFAGMSSDLSFF